MDELLELLKIFLEASLTSSGASLFAPLIVFLAGVLSAFLPCCLLSVPLIIGYVGYGSVGARKGFLLSSVFSIGFVVSTTLLGLLVVSLGSFLKVKLVGSWWYLVLSVLMILMALQIWEVIRIVPSTDFLGKSKKRGFLGAFVAGCLASLFSSPCSTPILVVLLTLVSQSRSVLFGTFLMFLYALGHCVIFILAGTFTGAVKGLMNSGKYKVLSQVLKWVSGGVIMLIGLYLFYLGI